MSNPNTVVSNVPMELPGEVSHAAIAACTEDYVFIAANQLMADFYGMQARDLIGRSVFDFYPKFKSSVFYDGAHETITTGKKTARIGYSSNTKRWLLVKTFMAGNHPVLSAEPLPSSAHVIYEDRLDAQTSLKNVFALDADLADYLARQQKFGLVLFQIKSLTELVNVHSNRIIELTLMKMAAKIRSSTSSHNQVYRLDEDLFGMIVPMNFGMGSVNLEIHRALSAVNMPFEIDDALLTVHLNYGLATTEVKMAASEMLKSARDNLKLRAGT